jgi:hypothetical protein
MESKGNNKDKSHEVKTENLERRGDGPERNENLREKE